MVRGDAEWFHFCIQNLSSGSAYQSGSRHNLERPSSRYLTILNFPVVSNVISALNKALYFQSDLRIKIIERYRVLIKKPSCTFEFLQGDSLDRGPKLLSIKNYVIRIMT